MRRNIFKATCEFLFIVIFVFGLVSFGYSGLPSAQNLLSINLIYPQKSNALKRGSLKIAKPLILKGKVEVSILGIDSKQLDNPNLYIECFVDNDQILLANNGQLNKQNPYRFILDATQYVNGIHVLVVNLWDKDGPAAIGISKFIVQNAKNEN